MTQWQPVETAPKDRVILIYGKPSNLILDGNFLTVFHRAAIFTAEWDDIDASFVLSGGSWLGPFVNPTHWMPLPDPPKEPEK